MPLTVTINSAGRTVQVSLPSNSTVADLSEAVNKIGDERLVGLDWGLDPTTPLSSLKSLVFNVRDYLLGDVETVFNNHSRGQVKKYALSREGKYKRSPILKSSSQAATLTNIVNEQVVFSVYDKSFEKLRNLPHRNFITIVSRSRSTDGNFLQEIPSDFAFIFVFVEFRQYRDYVRTLRTSNNHLVVALPEFYEGRGAPTPRQFAKLFIEALNARLETKATHFIMADDDLLHCNRRFKGKKTVQKVSLTEFILDLFVFGRENPHFALVSPRPKHDQGRSFKDSSGLTGHNQKLVLININLTSDVQYLPEGLLLLSAAKWNELVQQEANNLAEEIYQWKQQLKMKIAAKQGRTGERWTILGHLAENLGLKPQACREIETELMHAAPKQDKKTELESLVKKFKLNKKTFLTTGEDFRFSGQLLGKNLNSCVMLNRFFLAEKPLASTNETGSFLPTPTKQHQRMMHVLQHLH